MASAEDLTVTVRVPRSAVALFRVQLLLLAAVARACPEQEERITASLKRVTAKFRRRIKVVSKR